MTAAPLLIKHMKDSLYIKGKELRFAWVRFMRAVIKPFEPAIKSIINVISNFINK